MRGDACSGAGKGATGKRVFQLGGFVFVMQLKSLGCGSSV